jgi:hypothetical protein
VLEVRFLHGSSTYNQADWLGHRRGTSNSQLLQRSVPLPHKIGRPRWSAVAVDTISRDKGNTAAGAVVVHAFSHFSAFSAASTAASPTTPPFLLWPRLRSTDREGEKPSNACLQNVFKRACGDPRMVRRAWEGPITTSYVNLSGSSRGRARLSRQSNSGRAEDSRQKSPRIQGKTWHIQTHGSCLLRVTATFRTSPSAR